jgi:hypothetical protein
MVMKTTQLYLPTSSKILDSGQRALRQALDSAKQTIDNQVGQP